MVDRLHLRGRLAGTGGLALPLLVEEAGNTLCPKGQPYCFCGGGVRNIRGELEGRGGRLRAAGLESNKPILGGCGTK